MKQIILLIVTLMLCASAGKAQSQSGDSERHDSLYVYLSWEAVWAGDADTVVLDPDATVYTPYDIEFRCDKKSLNNLIKKDAVAVSLGDTLWMVNSRWLKKNDFEGSRRMRNYVPLYISPKIAFVHWAGVSIPDFFYHDVDLSEFMEDSNLYIIAFDLKRMVLVNQKQLSFMLEEYPDLKIRYESLKSYKEQETITDYFLQYVDRINADPLVLPLF